MAWSSSGLGHRPLKAKIGGSNPLQATKTSGRSFRWPAFLRYAIFDSMSARDAYRADLRGARLGSRSGAVCNAYWIDPSGHASASFSGIGLGR